MAVITKPNTFSAGATIIASEHNDNFDTIYNEFNGSIDNANIKAAANIAGSKLAQITQAAKVHGSSLTGLGSIDTATAGQIPGAAIDTGVAAGKIIAVATGNLLPTIDGRNLTNLSATAVSNLGNITAAQGIIPSANINTGTTANKILYVDTGNYYPAVDGRNITRLNATNLSSGTVATGRLGSGTADTTTFLRGDGAWAVLTTCVVFTADGNWTCPTGVNKVYLSGVGGGGGGGAGGGTNAGGGGSSGGMLVKLPYTVVATSAYVVDIGAGGQGGQSAGADGANGSNTTFNTTIIAYGGSGGVGDTAGGAGGPSIGGFNGSATAVGGNNLAGGSGGTRSGATAGRGGGCLFGLGATVNQSADNNTGAGGGGGGASSNGGNGGSGILIIEY